MPNPESRRLAEDAAREGNWKRWGPYLSERQWGTVREDYSPDGSCWTSFPHDHARSRAYRWGEDGLLGICDRQGRLCFALALWNGKDPILKERLFGLTGPEGNHGEDVKEEYFYLDSTPTHSYMHAMYRYPHAAYPYDHIVAENAHRTRDQPEYELADTGVLDKNRFFDAHARYAKASPNDLLIQITITNRADPSSSAPAELHLIPQLWFHNTWTWGQNEDSGGSEGNWAKPRFGAAKPGPGEMVRLESDHVSLGKFRFVAESARTEGGTLIPGELLFTENHTNLQRHPGGIGLAVPAPGVSAPVPLPPSVPGVVAVPYFKDAFHARILKDDPAAVNPEQTGSKAGLWYRTHIPPGESITIRLRLTALDEATDAPFGPEFDATFAARAAEADAFYDELLVPRIPDPDDRRIARQAYAGLLWNKQFYQYIVKDWIAGDANMPQSSPARAEPGARNADWQHVFCRDVISMPDKWEYPWFAAWDLAFHMVAMAKLDPAFAKDQLLLMLREWYMHPSGAIPAYEFAFGDVNPPVHAWACWRVYKMTAEKSERDRVFLARAFHKLLLNFTWWVNRKDPDGKHLFSGGFLGLDNIGVFDRGKPLPGGGYLEQADGTAWMAFFCGTMLSISLELAQHDPAYEDVASKFFEHFVAIIDAMNTLGGTGLWDDADGFYYDHIRSHNGAEHSIPLRLRSMVGIIPLLAVEIGEDAVINRLPGFKKRLDWFLKYRTDLAQHITSVGSNDEPRPDHAHMLMAIPSFDRLRRVLDYVFNESEFLSPHGVRSMSKVHQARPYVFQAAGEPLRVEYTPGESTTAMFGGNSNWRGPVWFPINFLLIEALERYHHFYADTLQIEVPSGSGNRVNLDQAAQELRRRLVSLFQRSSDGSRPCFGPNPRFDAQAADRELLQFHEYFHAETGRGLGASHQTGWTALVAILLQCPRQRS